MPDMYGGGARTAERRWAKAGIKPGGWLLTHATDDMAGTPSVPLFPLHFCPSCAPIVLATMVNLGGAA